MKIDKSLFVLITTVIILITVSLTVHLQSEQWKKVIVNSYELGWTDGYSKGLDRAVIDWRLLRKADIKKFNKIVED